MTAGVITLIAVLAVVTPLGVAWRRRQGKLRVAGTGGLAPGMAGPAASAARDVLTAADLRHDLGAQATLVQFSSAFCAPCRATRQILGEVAAMMNGVHHVELDAESRLDLVRRLNIFSTPTVLVLGPDGAIARKASGQPRKADVIAALCQLAGGQHSAGTAGEAAVAPAGD